MEQALLLSKGKPQFAIIYEMMYQFIQSNLFVPCWRELKQVSTICEGVGLVKADDKEGTIIIKITCNKYVQTFKLKIPYSYPEVCCCCSCCCCCCFWWWCYYYWCCYFSCLCYNDCSCSIIIIIIIIIVVVVLLMLMMMMLLFLLLFRKE